ncbi:glycosyltransferase family 2 protein, partial [Roseiconus lacunae]|uniref:glycosyltransferase family 2 protein n=1 Tax=Roseiconus lacunae TaxID=2605694 RepID=UPI0011F32628
MENNHLGSSDSSVSVVIALFNGAQFIKDTVESIGAQTVRPCCTVIVDDKSTDNGVSIAASACETHGLDYKVVRRPRNSGGPAAPINDGVRETSSRWVALLDQDDLLMPTRIEDSLRCLSVFSHARFLAGDYQSFSESGDIPGSNAAALSGISMLSGGGGG